MTERITTVGLVRRLSPPWLRRKWAVHVMEGIAGVIDAQIARLVRGAKLRYPGAPPHAIDADALALTGAERRIRRGPGEAATTYASRLVRWWDDHKGRGGPYALLRQLDRFFQSWLNVRMDVVYQSGTRRWIDAAATVEASVITRDSITWNGDASGDWSRFWVFFYVPLLIPGTGDQLITFAGDNIITQAGDNLVTDNDISFSSLSDSELELFRAIPREWSAAHITKIYVVLLGGDARLVGYPTGRLVGEPGMTVTPPQLPVITTIED